MLQRRWLGEAGPLGVPDDDDDARGVAACETPRVSTQIQNGQKLLNAT
jgi:hypothetical protein